MWIAVGHTITKNHELNLLVVVWDERLPGIKGKKGEKKGGGVERGSD